MEKKDDGKHGTQPEYIDTKSRGLPVRMRRGPNKVGRIVSRCYRMIDFSGTQCHLSKSRFESIEGFTLFGIDT